MDKEKLESVIIEEIVSEFNGIYNALYGDLKGLRTKCKTIANNILAKISDEVVIAEGEVGYYKIKGIDRSEYTTLKIGNATFNGVVREIIEQKYQGKSIRLKLEVLEGDKK